ncbi:hypothetical protein [Nocardia aurantiaca]|uniref:Uncharacterized protein n=1 Tax=Nocardia aurantiaca TaxID=2675850 RepID=A0A6I3L6T9_9NOCA|nr:hypothetical protein [Nocardia aurantiaca]MTE16156.1 hypothetical protein [Nocardia aurantiaca]
MIIGQIGSTAILAAGDSADSSSFSAGTLLIPAAGVVLLVVGLVLRNRTKATPAAEGTGSTGMPKHTGTIVAIAGVLVLALGLVATVSNSTTSSTHDPELAVGNCVTSSDYRGAQIGKIHPTSCDDRAAVYELAASVTNGATCPDGKLRDAGYFVLTDGKHSLCFAPNVKVGDCYSMQADVNQITPIDCASKNGPGVTVQIGGRFDGTTDTSKCPIPAGATITPQPARVVCWQPVTPH